MPKISSQLDHNKSKQIRVEFSIADQKPEGKKSRKCKEIEATRNLAGCEISQVTNFRNLQNFAGYEISQPAFSPLFKFLPLFMFPAFYFLTSFGHLFSFLPNLPPL